MTPETTEIYTIKLAADGAPTLNLPVHFIDQAAEAMVAYRERFGFGASEMKRGCGEIRDSAHRLICNVSYNGRAWGVDGKEVLMNELAPRPRPTRSFLAR